MDSKHGHDDQSIIAEESRLSNPSDNNNNNNDTDSEHRVVISNDSEPIQTELECFVQEDDNEEIGLLFKHNNQGSASDDESSGKSHSSCLSRADDWDQRASLFIHKLSLGIFDYLFLLGAFMFGSKFMPVTLVCSILLVGFGGFVFCAFTSLVTVIITEFGKRFFGRPRPNPQILGPKQFDLRTPLKNCSFPSGDTAQSAVYGTSLFVLMQNPWFFMFIPMAMWSRIYFGCHYFGDCIFGAAIGVAVGFSLWQILPHSFLVSSESTVHHLVNGL